MDRRIEESFELALVSSDRETLANLLVNDQLYSIESLEMLIIKILDRIGKKWEKEEYSLAQVFMSSLICEEIIDDMIVKQEVFPKDSPRIGIGVLQDYHALGKRMVMSILKASGYQVIDLGAGLNIDDFTNGIETHQLDIVIVSTLMLASALKVAELSNIIDERQSPVKVIAGGAPFRSDETLYRRVGADCDGKNATDIVKIVESIWEAKNE